MHQCTLWATVLVLVIVQQSNEDDKIVVNEPTTAERLLVLSMEPLFKERLPYIERIAMLREHLNQLPQVMTSKAVDRVCAKYMIAISWALLFEKNNWQGRLISLANIVDHMSIMDCHLRDDLATVEALLVLATEKVYERRHNYTSSDELKLLKNWQIANGSEAENEKTWSDEEKVLLDVKKRQKRRETDLWKVVEELSNAREMMLNCPEAKKRSRVAKALPTAIEMEKRIKDKLSNAREMLVNRSEAENWSDVEKAMFTAKIMDGGEKDKLSNANEMLVNCSKAEKWSDVKKALLAVEEMQKCLENKESNAKEMLVNCSGEENWSDVEKALLAVEEMRKHVADKWSNTREILVNVARNKMNMAMAMRNVINENYIFDIRRLEVYNQLGSPTGDHGKPEAIKEDLNFIIQYEIKEAKILKANILVSIMENIFVKICNESLTHKEKNDFWLPQKEKYKLEMEGVLSAMNNTAAMLLNKKQMQHDNDLNTDADNMDKADVDLLQLLTEEIIAKKKLINVAKDVAYSMRSMYGEYRENLDVILISAIHFNNFTNV